MNKSICPNCKKEQEVSFVEKVGIRHLSGIVIFCLGCEGGLWINPKTREASSLPAEYIPQQARNNFEQFKVGNDLLKK